MGGNGIGDCNNIWIKFLYLIFIKIYILFLCGLYVNVFEWFVCLFFFKCDIDVCVCE